MCFQANETFLLGVPSGPAGKSSGRADALGTFPQVWTGSPAPEEEELEGGCGGQPPGRRGPSSRGPGQGKRSFSHRRAEVQEGQRQAPVRGMLCF